MYTTLISIFFTLFGCLAFSSNPDIVRTSYWTIMEVTNTTSGVARKLHMGLSSMVRHPRFTARIAFVPTYMACNERAGALQPSRSLTHAHITPPAPDLDPPGHVNGAVRHLGLHDGQF